MKVLFKRIILSVGLLSLSAIPVSVYATNGYFLIGYGAKSRGMGGVGVAYGQDGLAAAANPATMVDVETPSIRFDIGGEYFRPKRAAKQNSAALESGFSRSDRPVNHRSGSNNFPDPQHGCGLQVQPQTDHGFCIYRQRRQHTL